MATGRTEFELKTFLEGSKTQYDAFIIANGPEGVLFFDKFNHAVYAKDQCIIKSNVASVELVVPANSNGTDKKTAIKLTYFDGKSEEIDTAIPDIFVRFDETQNLTDPQKEIARANIGAEAADATILKQGNVVNNLTTDSATVPLAAAQGKVLLGKITELTNNFNKLVGTDAQGTIDTFNEIVAFLENIENTDTLEGIIAGIEQQIADLQESSGVAKINELTGDIKIEGETTYIDDTYDDGSGDLKCTPIEVTTDKNSNKVSLEINRNGALGIFAMALEQASKTNESWVRFDNIDVNVKAATGEDEYHIELSSTPKVWIF